MADIKERIKKLLALSESPNENEARDALLKAKELMVKNKLTEEDFDSKEAKLVHIKCGVSWTTDSGNVWMANLCKVIAENYMCTAAWYMPKGTRTHELVITGLDMDVDLCKEIIKYAVGFTWNAIKVLQKKYGGSKKVIASSYAQGFILGLEEAFEAQKENHPEWGLVAVKPKEVQDYEETLGTKSVRTKEAKFDPLAYLKGQNDGRNFNAQKVLGNA